MKTINFFGLWLILQLGMRAQTENLWGMTRTEIDQRFAPQITSRGANGLTLQTRFYGREAEVYVGFVQGNSVDFIEVSFATATQSIPQSDRLKLFEHVRRQLETLAGKQYYYVRVDGIDVFGESGGWIPDKSKNSAFVFGTTIEGVVHQLEICGANMNDLLKAGDIKLTIDRVDSVQPPSVR